MARISLEEALNNIEMTYDQLDKIVKDLTREYFNPIKVIVNRIDDVCNMSNNEIRSVMIELGLKCFDLADLRDKALLKAELAEALRKEAISKNFTLSEGTAVVKEHNAIIESSSQIVVEALYQLISNLFKSKMQEMHSLIDSLKTILTSRLSEQKLAMNNVD